MSKFRKVDVALAAMPTGGWSEPPPGSNEALDRGCTCAVLDNADGQGVYGMGGTWWVTADCPLHGFTPNAPPAPEG